MKQAIIAALSAAVLATTVAPPAAEAAGRERYEVFGVGADDMLKMRAGPGTGYIVILGLPNGTVLRIHDCTQTGATRWCEVSLDGAARVRGFVSMAYLRAL